MSQKEIKGWIKLHRQIKHHWIFKNPIYFHAWVAIILEVNHAPNKFLIGSKLMSVKPGESLRSLESWAHLFGNDWTKQKVRTFFRLLKADSMINTENEHQTTRLSVCNYGTYQTSEHGDDTQGVPQKTCTEHARNTHVTPNKKEKKEKEGKEEDNPKPLKGAKLHDLAVSSIKWPDGCDESLKNIFLMFLDERRLKKKYVTVNAIKGLFGKLDGFSRQEQMDAINDAIAGGYQGFFPKQTTNGPKEQEIDFSGAEWALPEVSK